MARRLLLVEDDATLLDVLQVAFSRRGWDVHSAKSLDEGLTLFPQCTPDVVLTDKNLPGGAIVAAQAGVELVRAIRDRDRDVGIVLMTAYGTTESARDTLNLGIDEYLEKPFGNLFEVVIRLELLADRVAARRHAPQPAPRKDAQVVLIAASATRGPAIAKLLAPTGCAVVFVEKPDEINASAKSARADVVLLDGASYPEEITCLVTELKVRARSAFTMVLSQNLTLSDVKRLIELEVRALIDVPIERDGCGEQLRQALHRLSLLR
jgi:DNA-binding NtrC family response regulator